MRRRTASLRLGHEARKLDGVVAVLRRNVEQDGQGRTMGPGKPTQLVRRYLYTTPTGRIAVEMFKDATGKPKRAFLEAD